jgi:hypothetical protein
VTKPEPGDLGRQRLGTPGEPGRGPATNG